MQTEPNPIPEREALFPVLSPEEIQARRELQSVSLSRAPEDD